MQKIIALTVLLMSMCQAQSQDKKVLKFVDEYKNVACWKIQENHHPLMKWSSDVKVLKYRIEGDFRYMNEKSWKKFITEVSQLSGITFLETDGKDFDILIYFGDLQSYAQLSGATIPPYINQKLNNWSSRMWNENYNITTASFCLVPSLIRDSQEGSYHIKKGFLKALGLLGEIEDKYSIFYKYQAPTNIRISRKDKRFVKLHYNISIKAGMRIRDIKDAVLKVPHIEELSTEKL